MRGSGSCRLRECRLDGGTLDKTLLKIVESLRICDAAKQELSAMKRCW